MDWQVQEAKQRFSEVLRAVRTDGPQTITRHGEEVAVVIDMAEYRRLLTSRPNLTDVLLGGPRLDDIATVMDEVALDRRNAAHRSTDLGLGE